jgi:hypothetical protein
MADDRYVWQPPQQSQHFRAAPQRTAGQFADDEGVALDFVPVEECAERRVAPPQMLDPNRGINQHGQGPRAGVCDGDGLRAGLGCCPLRQPTAWRFPGLSRLPARHGRPQSFRQCR